MIRLLAAVQTRNNPFFHSVQTDWCYADSGTPEPKLITALLPALLFLPMQPPEQVPFWEGPAPEGGTRRVSGEPSRRKGSAHTSLEGRGLRPPAQGAPPRRARGVSRPGAIDLADIRDRVPGYSVVNSSFWRPLSVR